jgi:hypothetical protein
MTSDDDTVIFALCPQLSGSAGPKCRERAAATRPRVRFVPADNETADAVLHEACAAGINYFDTAPQYGQGKSEARIGRILQTRRATPTARRRGR